MKKLALALCATIALPVHAAADPDAVRHVVQMCDNYAALAGTIMQNRHNGRSANDAYEWVESLNKESVREALLDLTTMAYIEPEYSTTAQRERQVKAFRNDVFQKCVDYGTSQQVAQ